MAELWPKMSSAELVFFLHFLGGGPTCSDLAQILHTGSLGEVFRGEFSFGGPKMKNGRYMAIYGR